MRHYTEEILRNAEKLNQLKARKGESTKHHDKNDHKRKEWGKACADFHARYDSLALSGGLDKKVCATRGSVFLHCLISSQSNPCVFNSR